MSHVMLHTCNLSTWEVKEGRSGVESDPELQKVPDLPVSKTNGRRKKRRKRKKEGKR